MQYEIRAYDALYDTKTRRPPAQGRSVMSLSIDEAIRHAEDKARELGCTECAQEHRQLAAWLRELKFRRKAQAALDAARWRADEAARKTA